MLSSLLKRFRKSETIDTTETPSPERRVDAPADYRAPAPKRGGHRKFVATDLASGASAAVAVAEAPARKRRKRKRSKSGSAEDTTTTGAARIPVTFDGELPVAFAALGIGERALQSVGALGFDEPTPIQQQAIPILLEGRDVVGLAQTGTGKTLAFGLPLAGAIDAADDRVQAIVLVPTRELATQVYDTIDHISRYFGFQATILVGGRKLTGDFERLDGRPSVIVGTPGRVIDHIKRGTLDLSAVRFVVLDEADQMFDIGFARDINYILRHVPRQRQAALFSATMPPEIAMLVRRFMPGAHEVAVETSQKPAEGVRQLYCEVAERDKVLALRHLYENLGLGRSLIFRRTRIGVDRLTRTLQEAGVPARAIHGDLRQAERDSVMRDFREGRLEFLVATNVASRGLDIPDIEHVINYDVPQNAEEYIHRVGRTARAGKTGTAVTFVSEWDLEDWQRIVGRLEGDQPEYLELPSRWD